MPPEEDVVPGLSPVFEPELPELPMPPDDDVVPGLSPVFDPELPESMR